MNTLDKDTLAMLTDEEREAIEAGDDATARDRAPARSGCRRRRHRNWRGGAGSSSAASLRRRTDPTPRAAA